ncbi:MAG TPA: L-arabinose isomerase [Candidatus Limnocylindrales bacterium]
MKSLGQHEVWFVTGSQDLYGPDALRQVAENAAAVVAALDASSAIPVRVVFRPVVASPEAIAATCLEANANDACVGVIAWMHTFSPARMWIAGLQALAKPLLHLHTQFNRDLPWAEIDMDFMNLHQAAHGDREFGYIETRLRVARKTVAGHWKDPYVADRIGAWSRAACAWREAHRLKVARFGDNMRQVADTEGDKVEAQIRLGVTVNGYGSGELGAAVRDVSDADVDLLLEAYADEYDVVPELGPGGARREELREAARIESGLRTVLTAGGFGAFTDTFEDLDGLRQLPGIAAQRLMADGYGFGAEGDWKSAVLVRLLKVMATGLPGGTSFMEDYTYDLDPASPSVLGAHMLEVCPSIAAGRPRCEIHPLGIGGKADPVRLVFDAAPGGAIVAGLTDLGDRFRLVANVIDIVAAGHELPRLPVARAVWKPRPDMRTAVEAWLSAGGAHHTALSRAIGPEPLIDFAEMAGIELLLIDATTTVAGFRREVRWNQAYHHLARGF